MRYFTGKVQVDGKLLAKNTKPYVFGDTSIFFQGFIANVQAFLSHAYEESSQNPESNQLWQLQALKNAYEQWGENLSKHIYGEYAVAIYNSTNKTLLLAHDSLGIVPLYYYDGPDGIVFTSNINGIVNRNSSFELDEEYIADYLCYGDHYGERTPYTKIKRLTPGISISYVNRKIKKNDCWGISDIKPIRYADKRDYEDHFRVLLKEGVKSSLPTQGKIWCELSGGLDSSSVLCAAVDLNHSLDIQSLSFVYPQSPTADESKWFNAVIEKCGVTSHKLNADMVRPFTELPRNFCGQPYHAIANSALYRLYGEMLAKNDVDVVLTGMGGDAVLFGDGPEPFFFADLLCRGRFFALAQHLALWTNQARQFRPMLYWLEHCAISPAIRQFRHHVIQDQLPNIPWLSDNYELGMQRTKRARKSWIPWDTSVADSWFLERIIRCSNIVSQWDYTSSMRAEFRHPLMYVPLIEFMYAIPWEVKLSPTSDRVLQRAACAEMLPSIITKRDNKAGPDQAFYCGLASGFDWLELLTQQPLLVKRGYIDSKRWSNAVKLAQVGRCESIKHLIAAATLEIWLRQLYAPFPKSTEPTFYELSNKEYC